MAPYMSLATAMLVFGSGVLAAFKPPINSTLEPGVATECKTCPYKLCTNTAFYDYDTQVSAICWTRGTEIDGDDTWLRTQDNCYITQYDLVEYSGDWNADLSYCGQASEELILTYDDATVKYNSECNLCPDNYLCETIQYLKPDTELTTTCWTDLGEQVIDSTTWLKTTDNCYVNQIHLEEEADKSVLAYCGPVGFIQTNGTTDVEAAAASTEQLIDSKTAVAETKQRPAWSHERRSASPAPVPAPLPEPLSEAANELHKRYLINITVGEEYAVCYKNYTSSAAVVTQYEFGTQVWMQCYVSNYDAPIANETAWYLTTDFCYVKEVDFFESLYDQYRFPSCSLFE